MEVEKVVGLIVESSGRLERAIKLSTRDEKWWAFMEKEFWVLTQQAWALRGVILKRGEESSPDLDDKVTKQLKEILKDSDAK